MATKSVYDPKTNTTTTQYIPDIQEVQPVSVNPNTGKTNAQVLTESTAAAQKAASMIGTTYTPPTTTPTINSENLGATTTPKIPTQTAPAINETFVNSLTTEAENNRKALEASYKAEQERIKTAKAETQAKIDNFTTLQQTGALDNIDTLTQPFRQDLETKQREELYINENFQANQKLTNELDSLLTEGTELIKRQKEQGGLASIAIPNLNKTISDVNARAGVIQAVMSARNGQISQAYTMIDRTVSAINADRKDRIDYFSTLYNFYGDQKTTEQNKLLSLTADEKKYVEAQIGLLENDLARSQATADALKEAMTNPETALEYANAGITLNDTVEQINEKLAKYAPIKEAKAIALKMMEKYPDAGITLQDSVATVNQKIKSSSIYKKSVESTKKTSTASGQPTDQSDIFDVLQSSAGGKATTDSFRNSFEKGYNVLYQLKDLDTSLVDENTGPILGIIRSANPYDQKAQQIAAQLTAIVPNLARGIYGEVGVLTDNDIALYSKTLPNLKSTNELRDALLAITTKSVSRALENKLRVQAAGGIDVSEFAFMLKDSQNVANSLLENSGMLNTAQEPTQKLIDIGKTNPAYQGVIINLQNKNPELDDAELLQLLEATYPEITTQTPNAPINPLISQFGFPNFSK